jgi:mRNA-degrading endonuclease RelE of RelBE toxin-antitoxin system
MGEEEYVLVFTPLFERVIRRLKKKNPDLVRAIASYFPKLERNPELGKPLKHTLRNYRRIHIAGSFVLLYEIKLSMVLLVDFDHHDRIYEKYS